MPVIPDGYGQVNWRFGGPGCPTGAEVTLGYRIDGSGSPAEDAEAAHGAMVGQIIGSLSNQITLENVHIKHGPNDDGPAADYPGSDPGGVSDECASPAICIIVRKNTALGGHAGSGRLFMPGCTEAQLHGDGTFDGPALGLWVTDWEAFRTELVGAEMTPVLLQSVATSRGPITITSMVPDALAGTQRRRLRR